MLGFLHMCGEQLKRRKGFFTPDTLEDVLIAFGASVEPLRLPCTRSGSGSIGSAHAGR